MKHNPETPFTPHTDSELPPPTTLPSSKAPCESPGNSSSASRLSRTKPWEPQSTVDPEPGGTPPLDASPATAGKSPFLPAVPGYEILSELGRGGMGVVYRARHVQLNRAVALKMVLGGDLAGEQQRLRFLIEAEMAARVRHPNIAQVYDVGTFQDRPYYALEFVAGGTLHHKLDGKRLPPREAAGLVAKLAQAVQAAHAQGIIHRDLKPANVLLEPDGTPKIIDFGLAKQTSATCGLTVSGALVGTPRYMAPEQAAGDVRRHGPLVDVWALGVILYEALTGFAPFVADTALDTLDLVRHSPAAPPRRLTPGIHADLEVICLKCLEKQPEQRYASAQALVDDLQRFLEDRPILARPAGSIEKTWRWCRRNRAAAGLVAAIAFLVLGLAVGGPVIAIREADLRQRAEGEEAKARNAAEAERRAKADLEKRLGQIAKHNDLLLSIFHDLDPKAEEKGGPSLRVQLGKRLDQASAELEGEAVGDPLEVASLQSNLGRVQCELGNLDQAIALLTKARATRAAQLGPTHPDTLRAAHNLASTYREAARLADAIPILEQLRTEWQRLLGPSHPDTLSTLHELAFAYKSAGQTAKAIALYEEVRDQRTRQLGPDDPETLNTLNNLGNLYRETGRRADAVRTLEQVRDLKVKALGPEHADTLVTLHNLAVAYRDVGRVSDAIPLLEHVRDRQVIMFGRDHPSTLATRLALGNTCRLAGRPAEAMAMLESLRDDAVAKLGGEHPVVLATLNSLAVAYQDAGKASEAIPLLEQVRDLAAKKLGPDHPNVLGTLNNLATAYQAAGRSADAITLMEQVRDLTAKKLGPEHPTTVSALGNLGIAYLSAKEYGKAERVLRELLAIRERKEPELWSTFETQLRLGEALISLQKYAEAEPLLLHGLKAMQQHQDKMPPTAKLRVTDALNQLVRLYDAWGKADEAAKWKKLLDK